MRAISWEGLVGLVMKNLKLLDWIGLCEISIEALSKRRYK